MTRRKNPTTCRECRAHKTRHRSAICAECRDLPRVERAKDGGVILLGQVKLSEQAARSFADLIHDTLEGGD